MWGLLAGLGVLAGVVAACGGSTSSTTGPSSGGAGSGSAGAIVQGQVVNRRAASGESVMFLALRTALGIGLAEAAPGETLAGIEVTLTRLDDGATLSGTTDASGQFIIANVLPGTYKVTAVDPDPVTGGELTVTTPDTFTVGAGDTANITLTVTEAEALDTVNVAAVETDPAVVLANPAQVGHMLNIAKAAGMVSANPVLDLRLAGWGWGRIARHFNVHPSVIGLGRGGVSDTDIVAFQDSHGPGNGKNKGNGKGKGKGKV
jgi:hypothetical protein